MYTFQVSDSDLVLSTPRSVGAPFAMTILNRLEWSGIGTSTTTSPYFHLEFVNNDPGLVYHPYGAGIGFFADTTLTLNQPFIIWPHATSSFDNTHGDFQSGYQTLGIAIDTGFLGTGYVGIYGNPYPEYPLDVGGDTRVQGDLHLGGNVINTAGIISGVNSSFFASINYSYIGVNGTGVGVYLPSTTQLFAGKQYIIKDESGTASPSNPITIYPDTSLIDGASSLQIRAGYASVTILWAGSFWSII